ncbi:MAG: YHS domain-containing protein [Sandaracinaceae bacterium]|nr:YHS domain-containing protein [Sandaracinaceae bacterium]
MAFADLVGYSALTFAHGDAEALRVATTMVSIARASLVEDARLVKTLGDGVLVAGPCPAVARSAVALAMGAREIAGFPMMRIGVDFGDVLELEGDLYGATVNVASRLCAAARPGQIVCSARAAAGLNAFKLSPLGSFRLKHVLRPMEVFELLCGVAAAEMLDPVCRMPVDWVSLHRAHEGTSYRFCSETCAAAFDAAPELYTGA